jgi:ribulose 1,5-bisphosphate synthetase/thiazole synthase
MKNGYDVVVVGGGLCGFACALSVAQSDRKVLLVERRPVLGWESTWACQLDLGDVNSPIARRILDELRSMGGLKGNTADAPILEMILDGLADEGGLSVLLYSYPVRLIYEDDAAFGVVLGSKSGERIVKAGIIVDATEKASLWRHTDIRMKAEKPVPAVQSVFFNHVDDGLELPIDLGGGITVYPSAWRGEVRVEYEIDETDPLAARQRMVDVIKTVREEVPQLKDALLSHSGNEPFPKTSMVEFEEEGPIHPTIKNLFGAGIWASEAENTPAGRLALGERIGEIVSRCEGVREFPSEMMTGSLLREPEVVGDVIVVGGGTGGSIAAIAAGREGVKTLLIEASPILGGIGTGGAIHWYCVGLSGGLQDEVDRRVKELTPLFAGRWNVNGFHPEAKKVVLQQMAQEAGVDILLNTVVTGVLLKGGRAQLKAKTGTELVLSERKGRRSELLGVIAAGPDGVAVYGAKVFIDSTGDGDIAAMSGAPFIVGRERDNLMHAYSQPAGKLDRDGRLSFFNFDAGYVDPTDVEDLTRARREGIRHYRRERFSEENRLLYIAPIIGLRQSRHIIGEYQLTLADEIAGRRFEDAVSFMKAFYDNHGFDYENESDEALLWVWALGDWSRPIGCEVPYRCLLPKNVEGLLLACRAISLTYDAHAGFRMQRDIQRIGEVAGLAAAMAVKEGIKPREIEVAKLQSALRERGILDERYRPKPAIPEHRGRRAIMPPDPSSLNAEDANSLVWIAAHTGRENALALREMLNSDDPEVRFKGAVALAWHGLDEGVSELLRCVQERRKEKPRGNKTVPMWQAAIPFLGISGDRQAVPTLIEILKDRETPLDALIAAVRALGRIGDERAIPALRQLLERENLPTERHLQVSVGGINPIVEDARWQLDLAVAESLSTLGVSEEEVGQIVKPYLSDPRAYVRRYAEKLRRQLI